MRTKQFSDKSPLEQSIFVGLKGAPELKREERRHLLGQFRERVIKVLTFEQIAEPGTYPEINQAIAHPKARRLLISRKANISSAAEYIRLARKFNLSFTTVDLPEYKGPIGLVVAADEAIDQEEIVVPNRAQRLIAAGIPKEIVDAKGKGLCADCLQLLKKVTPEEVKNYRQLSIMDKLLNNHCPCKKKKQD